MYQLMVYMRSHHAFLSDNSLKRLSLPLFVEVSSSLDMSPRSCGCKSVEAVSAGLPPFLDLGISVLRFFPQMPWSFLYKI